MKLNARSLCRGRSLFLGVCLVLTTIAATVPAEARSNTGFNAFRIWISDTNKPTSSYTDAACLDEVDGSVVNNCKSTATVNLTFDSVIDNAGSHTLTVTGAPGGTEPVSCTLHAFLAGALTSSSAAQNVNPGESTSFTINVDSGGSMSLYCTAVPVGSGIATLSWNP
jgi:hypothetical protein